MTTIHTYNPADGAVPPGLPPMSIATLAVGLVDVLSDAHDLPQPRYISIHECSQGIALQFAPAKASVKALTRWALRFGAVLTSVPYQDEDSAGTVYRVQFDYNGMAAEAYAVIRAGTAST
jgi:hypothetical protein